ncbi:hypothetical protein D3C87_766300 [compost metagenome]
MRISVERVGKRWYRVNIYDGKHWLNEKQLARIEATRHDGCSWSDYKTTWTLTGFGSKKHRLLAVEELNKLHDKDNFFKQEWETRRTEFA